MAETEMIEIDLTLGDAICDMEDIGFDEGLGPGRPDCQEAWAKLVAAAERSAHRVTHAKRSPRNRFPGPIPHSEVEPK